VIAHHVGGVPVEELFPMAAFAGGALVVARTWVLLRLRRLRRRVEGARVVPSGAGATDQPPGGV
jgi:hypothetical protein